MSDNSRGKTFWAWFSVILTVSILVLVMMKANEQNKIIGNRIILCADITDVSITKGGLANLDYEFYYEGKLYKKKAGCRAVTKEKYYAGKKQIWIAAEINNVRNNVLLEQLEDFFRFEVISVDTVGKSCNQ